MFLTRRRVLRASAGAAALMVAGCAPASQPPGTPATSQPTEGPAKGPAAKLQKLTASLSSPSFSQMTFPVAQEGGLFSKYGLDVEVVQNANAMPPLLAGQAHVATASSEDLISANLGGAPIIATATLVPYLQHVIVARPEVNSMQDLLGRPVGITARGSLPHTVLRMAAQQAGMDPERDLVFISFGSPAQQLVGLVAGSVFACSFSPPNDGLAEQQGMHVLVNYRAQNIPYPAAQVMVNRDWAASNDAAVIGLLKGIAEAAAFTRTRPEFTTEIYSKWAQVDSGAAMVATQNATQAVPVKMLPTAAGIQNVLNQLALTTPTAKEADPARFFDDSYIKRIDGEGFYAALPT
jgi:ABC-type nitrate/sulfonate/bicarbonate transport system substrate-binding protein